MGVSRRFGVFLASEYQRWLARFMPTRALCHEEIFEEVIAHNIQPIMGEQGVIHERGVDRELCLICTCRTYAYAEVGKGQKQQCLAFVTPNGLLSGIDEVYIPPRASFSIEL